MYIDEHVTWNHFVDKVLNVQKGERKALIDNNKHYKGSVRQKKEISKYLERQNEMRNSISNDVSIKFANITREAYEKFPTDYGDFNKHVEEQNKKKIEAISEIYNNFIIKTNKNKRSLRNIKDSNLVDVQNQVNYLLKEFKIRRRQEYEAQIEKQEKIKASRW